MADDSWYSKLVKKGWLGSMPQTTQRLDSQKNWKSYTPDTSEDMVGETLRRMKKKTTEASSDE